MGYSMKGEKFAATFFTFLFFSIGAGLAGAATGLKGCSSSCGPQSINHPFYLRGDEASCGVAGFELICEGNTTTILEQNPVRYVVSEISYEHFTLHVVDAKLESGHCIVPSRLQFIWNDRENEYLFRSKQNNWVLGIRDDGRWANFVNCSTRIPDEQYHYIPCLSAKNTSVYVSCGDEIRVQELPRNCQFLSSVPTGDFATDGADGTDIFQILQQGFTISWGPNRTRVQLLQNCLIAVSGASISANFLLYLFSYGSYGFSMFKWLLYPFTVVDQFLCCMTEYNGPTVFNGYNLFDIGIYLAAAILLSVIAMLIRCIVAPLIIYGFLAKEYRRLMVPIDRVEKFLRNQQTLTPRRYVYTDIIAMTRHFRDNLGQGGFGSVYRGELPGGHLVAIKVLCESRGNGEDFISEVSTIGMIHHLNVVRLVGFCSEGSKRALVYEFMPNGSLDKYIFPSNGTRRRFTQEKLNEIALGVARGIDYLHRGCDMRILHFDIKPHNILLDQNFNPKVSDFGLAKLYSKDYSLVSLSAARGTIGYIAPELVSRSFGVISYKSDVYSFGMLLLEMAGGRRNVDHRAENSSEVYYPSWIYDRLLQSGGPETSISVEIDHMERKLCKVGLWCIQMRPVDRPPMSRVIEMLEAELDTLQMPPKPFFSTPGPVSFRQSFMGSFPSDLTIISEDE